MKTVLAYGDSLTWGYDATGPSRHPLSVRWPSVLSAGLGEGVEVVAEGLNGRTTAFDDHLADCDRNGARLLPTILHTHAPLDLVVIMLGTNDLKPHIHGTAWGARQGVKRLVSILRQHEYPIGAAAPEILIVAPCAFCKTENAGFATEFDDRIAQSKQLASLYEALAEEVGCAFFDANTVAETTPLDGVHLDAENTMKIGEALVPVVKEILAR